MVTSTKEEFLAQRQADKQRSDEMKKRQIILSLKDGDSARLHFLRDFYPVVQACKHDYFDKATPKNSVQAMCAADYGQTCYWCEQAKQNPKLEARAYIVLPAWVHSIKQATPPKNEEDVQTGLRLLLLGRKGNAVGTLFAYHEEEDTIQDCDFVYSREGSGLDTKYSLNAHRAKPLDKMASPAEEELLAWLAEAYPYRVLSGTVNDDDEF